MEEVITITVSPSDHVYQKAKKYCELMQQQDGGEWTIANAIIVAALIRLDERIKEMRQEGQHEA